MYITHTRTIKATATTTINNSEAIPTHTHTQKKNRFNVLVLVYACVFVSDGKKLETFLLELLPVQRITSENLKSDNFFVPILWHGYFIKLNNAKAKPKIYTCKVSREFTNRYKSEYIHSPWTHSPHSQCIHSK